MARLFTKLATVMGAVARVPKNGHNTFHGYRYVTEADLVEAVREHLAAQNVCLFVSADSSKQIDAPKGGPVTQVQMTITFACGDTGATFTVNWIGAGQDTGDKGVYKAFTGGLKYALLKCFLVSTGDDPEQVASANDTRASKTTSAQARPHVPPQSKERTSSRPVRTPSLEAARATLMPMGRAKGKPLSDLTAEALRSAQRWMTSNGRSYPEFEAACAVILAGDERAA